MPINATLQIPAETNWILNQENPYIIAGPCSIESEEQAFETIKQLNKPSINAIRGGIWKPRTRPGSFEGVGKIGLPWLVEAAKSIGKPSMCEVASPEHIDDALKAGIDMIWVGARTTVNPFSVQEIANALKGVKVPVFIKNPVNPDLALWIGAIERINQSGIDQIAAIHRGFSSFQQTIYRNEPTWEIAFEFRRILPEIPLICDPSHIGGRRDLLQPIAQQAMDLNFDGLMIESHYNPSIALSDAEQQLKPEKLFELLNTLIIRQNEVNDSLLIADLQEVRSKIDLVPEEIVNLLANRMDLVDLIAEIKKQHNIAILQPNRWAQIVQNRRLQGEKLNVNDDFVLRLFQLLHSESIKKQSEHFKDS